MQGNLELESWLVEAGDAVIRKRADLGEPRLTRAEALLYCLWVADYGMRNAGDLKSALDLDPEFQAKGVQLSRELGLPRCSALFELSLQELEEAYFQRLPGAAGELSTALCDCVTNRNDA